MKLSDIFRRASRCLPSARYACLCDEFNWELRRAEERCKRTLEEKLEFDRLYREANKIINHFKPKYARRGQYWFITKTTKGLPTAFSLFDIAKNAYVCESVEEVQAKRKEILLKCAEIAESKGL